MADTTTKTFATRPLPGSRHASHIRPLTEADHWWIECLRFGVIVLIANDTLLLINDLLAFCPHAWLQNRFAAIYFYLSGALIMLLYLADVWMVTLREPDRLSARSRGQVRRLTRLVILLATLLGFAIFATDPIFHRWPSRTTAAITVTVHLFADLCSLIAGLGCIVVIRRLMIRAGARFQQHALTALLVLIPCSAAVGYTGLRVVQFVNVMNIAPWHLPLRGGPWIEHATNVAILAVMITVLHQFNRIVADSFASSDAVNAT